MPFHNLKYAIKEPKIIGSIWVVMLPAFAQALLLSMANVLDLILIGSILPGSNRSMVNGTQGATYFVGFALFSITAFAVAGNVYYGQFLKTNNKRKIKETTNFKLLSSLMVFLLFLVIFYSVGQSRLLNLLYSGSTTGFAQDRAYGAYYLKWLMLATAPVIITSPLYATLNADKKAWVPLCNTIWSVGLNALFVYLLISGTGLHLGLKGVALGTLIARFIEIVTLCIYLAITRPGWLPSIKTGISKWSFKKMTLAGLMIWPSEALYPLFGLLSTKVGIWAAPYKGIELNDWLSIQSTTNVIGSLAFSLTVGCYAAVPYFVGSHLGRNEFQTARDNSKRVIGASFLAIMIVTLFIICSAFWYPYVFYRKVFYQNNQINNFYVYIAQLSIWSLSITFIIYACAVQMFTIVRSGGYQIVVSLVDQLPWFCIYLPATYLLYRYCNQQTPIWYLQLAGAGFDIPELIGAILLYYLLPWHKKNLIKTADQDNKLIKLKNKHKQLLKANIQ